MENRICPLCLKPGSFEVMRRHRKMMKSGEVKEYVYTKDYCAKCEYQKRKNREFSAILGLQNKSLINVTNIDN